MRLLKVKLLESKSDSYKLKISKHISNYELEKMKVLMMSLVYVFGVFSVCFYTIFSIFSGNFVLKKNLMIYLSIHEIVTAKRLFPNH